MTGYNVTKEEVLNDLDDLSDRMKYVSLKMKILKMENYRELLGASSITRDWVEAIKEEIEYDAEA